MEEALDQLPSVLSQGRLLKHVYERAFESVQSQYARRKEVAMKVICWIGNARCTLTTQLLTTALAVRPNEDTINASRIINRETLIDVCGGFVTLDKANDCLRFVHSTAHDFLQSKMPMSWNELTLALPCARYLGLEYFRSGPASDQPKFLERCFEYPLFEYACRHLKYHVQNCTENDDELCDVLIHFLKQERNKLAYLQVAEATSTLLDSGYDWFPTHSSPLHVAAHIGYVPVIRKFVEGNGQKWLQSRNSLGQTPLHIAAKEGHTSSCKVLIENGAPCRAQDRKGFLAAAWAVWHLHAKILDLFLDLQDTSYLVSTCTNAGESLLHLAVRRGDASMATKLLQKGVDIFARNSEGSTALDIAKDGGDISLSNILESAIDLAGAPPTTKSESVGQSSTRESGFVPRYLAYLRSQFEIFGKKVSSEIDIDPGECRQQIFLLV